MQSPVHREGDLLPAVQATCLKLFYCLCPRCGLAGSSRFAGGGVTRLGLRAPRPVPGVPGA